MRERERSICKVLVVLVNHVGCNIIMDGEGGGISLLLSLNRYILQLYVTVGMIRERERELCAQSKSFSVTSNHFGLYRTTVALARQYQ